MRKTVILILVLVVVQAYSTPWKMVWSDEFNYYGLPDSIKWVHEVVNTRNSELQ